LATPNDGYKKRENGIVGKNSGLEAHRRSRRLAGKGRAKEAYINL